VLWPTCSLSEWRPFSADCAGWPHGSSYGWLRPKLNTARSLDLSRRVFLWRFLTLFRPNGSRPTGRRKTDDRKSVSWHPQVRGVGGRPVRVAPPARASPSGGSSRPGCCRGRVWRFSGVAGLSFPSLFDNECGLRDSSLSRCASPVRREWCSAHAEERQNLSASSPPSRREHVSNDRSPCPGRSPAMSAESVTKISPSDARGPVAPVRAGGLDDWRGRPTKSSGRMPAQLAECQRTGCNGPTIVEAGPDSLSSQQPAASTRLNDLTSPSCN
jgi:hypothetical protein